MIVDRHVAIIGSGPAGLAAADQLNQLGHTVTVYEREDRIGGLLTYGIPTMKLDKAKVDRRVQVLANEGIRFKTGVSIGDGQSLREVYDHYDAVILAIGSTVVRKGLNHSMYI